MRTFLKGLLFGAGIGGTTGLFFAPKKGKELQKQMETYMTEIVAASKDTQTALSATQKKSEHTILLAEELLGTFQKGLQQDIEAFNFQTKPRMTRIQQQTATLKQHLATAKQNFTH